jgi:putative ATP-dependent endonuclease of OLD family
MYLKSIEINNFRKLKQAKAYFNSGLNLIVGPNDSGKTAIIDAIRFVLKQIVDDYSKIIQDDFNESSKAININIVFSFDDCHEEQERIDQLSLFAEYLFFDSEFGPELRVWYSIKNSESDIRFPNFKVGPTKEVAVDMDARCRENLKVVYLRPLRDAESELRARPGSRISRILNKHEDIINHEDELIQFLKNFKTDSEEFFKTGHGKNIREEVDRLLKSFDEQGSSEGKEIVFGPTEGLNSLKTLERLALYYDNISRPGLGTLNMIFIAAELLHLNTQKVPKLLLVEEIEAHLHPQRQLKIIKALQEESGKGVQMILTTHSPNLSSVVGVECLNMCYEGSIYSLAEGKTALSKEDYLYLGRFLDVTKANLFFTQGIILVEGPTEQLLIPEFVKIAFGYNLTDYGISLISINNLGFERFINIFKRKTPQYNPIPVAVITDADSRSPEKIENYTKIIEDKNNKIGCFVGPQLLSNTSQGGTTFEKIILNKTVLLKQEYIDAYNKLRKRKSERSEMKADMSERVLYSRIEKLKAPIAQEVAHQLEKISDENRDKIKSEITKEMKYIIEAISFVVPTQKEKENESKKKI